MDDPTGGLIWALAFILSVVAFFAVLRLFSIDASLKKILAELQAQRARAPEPAKEQSTTSVQSS